MMIKHPLGIPGGRVPKRQVRAGRKPGQDAEKKQKREPFAP